MGAWYPLPTAGRAGQWHPEIGPLALFDWAIDLRPGGRIAYNAGKHMETSLHQQLKTHYAGRLGKTEVKLGAYRIDVIRRGELIEIQHAGLGAIRDKIRTLCESHKVRVVKPIVVRKLIVKHDSLGGTVVSRRLSPKQGKLLDLFDDLVHFTRAFPHPRLTLEVALVEVEETRHPGHGRRRRWRQNDFEVADQELVSVISTHRFRTARDLLRLIPGKLPAPFDTAELATALGEPRWIAQRMAYCLRHMGAVETIGKRRGAWLYAA